MDWTRDKDSGSYKAGTDYLIQKRNDGYFDVWHNPSLTKLNKSRLRLGPAKELAESHSANPTVQSATAQECPAESPAIPVPVAAGKVENRLIEVDFPIGASEGVILSDRPILDMPSACQVTKGKKVWVCMNEKGHTLNRPGEGSYTVETFTQGEAKNLFKKVFGEKPTPGGKSKKTTRKRLPAGYRVRLQGFRPKALAKSA